MTKSELIEKVANETGLKKADAEKAVAATFGAISEALTARDKFTLVGFGTFDVKERPARTGKNPKTAEALEIAAKNSARFKPGKDLKSL